MVGGVCIGRTPPPIVLNPPPPPPPGEKNGGTPKKNFLGEFLINGGYGQVGAG